MYPDITIKIAVSPEDVTVTKEKATDGAEVVPVPLPPDQLEQLADHANEPPAPSQADMPTDEDVETMPEPLSPDELDARAPDDSSTVPTPLSSEQPEDDTSEDEAPTPLPPDELDRITGNGNARS